MHTYTSKCLRSLESYRQKNTPRGLFQYTRFSFGVKAVSAIFQEVMDTMLEGISYAAEYLDYIIIVGSKSKELRQRTEKVLTIINNYGFCLLLEQGKLFMNSIKYLGFVVDQSGRRPDPANIEDIM